MNTKVCMLVLNSVVNDSRVLKEAGSAVRAGFDVTVLGLQSEGLANKETIQGFELVRLGGDVRNFHGLSKIGIYLKFWLEFLFLFFRQTKILHCNDLNTLPLGVAAKLVSFGKIHLVYDAHEFALNEHEGQSLFQKIRRYALEQAMLPWVDRFLTVGRGIARLYAGVFYTQTPDIVMNCPLYQEPFQSKPDRFRERFSISKDSRIVLYQGGLMRRRGLEALLEAFTHEHQHSLVIMGYGELQPLVEQYAAQYPNIYFHDAVSPAELLGYTASADLGISMVEPATLNDLNCLPNKYFEYAMARIPVLTGGSIETMQLAAAYGTGVTIAGPDARDIQEGIQKAFSLNPANVRANLDRFAQKFCWEEQEKALICAYQSFHEE